MCMERVLERHQMAELKLPLWSAPVCIQHVQPWLQGRRGNQTKHIKIDQQQRNNNNKSRDKSQRFLSMTHTQTKNEMGQSPTIWALHQESTWGGITRPHQTVDSPCFENITALGQVLPPSPKLSSSRMLRPTGRLSACLGAVGSTLRLDSSSAEGKCSLTQQVPLE